MSPGSNAAGAISVTSLSLDSVYLPVLVPVPESPQGPSQFRRISLEVTFQLLDLLLLFSYSTGHACSSFPQILRGLLQEVRPRRLGRNRPLPCQLDLCGVLGVWRKAAVPALRGDTWPAAFSGPQKESGHRTTRSHGRSPWPTLCYFGKGASLMVLPWRADCRAASSICMTTTFVSSEVRSPSGCKLPLSTAAR
jgi:hypothetical protein